MKRQSRFNELLCVISLVAIGALSWAGRAQAATETWVGGTTTWNTGGNWSGRNLPPISNDSLVFGPAGAGGLLLNNDLTSGAFNIAGITFNPGADAFVIGDGTSGANVGNPFVLTGDVVNNSTALQTINNPFSMTSTRAFMTTAGGGDITLGGTITGAASGVNKYGLGTVTMNSITCTGAITVSAGTLKIGADSALSGGLNLGSTSNGGAFIYDNAGASGPTSMTLAFLWASAWLGEYACDNTVQVTHSAAQDVFLTFTTQTSHNGENGSTVNFVVNGLGVVNGTNAKIILADQTAYRITKPNSAYFNGGDFAVYDAGPDASYATPGDGFVRGIKYGVDNNSRTSAAGATFTSNALTGAGTTYNQEVTGDITAQPSITLGTATAQNNGTLKIVGESDITMVGGATLTIDNQNDTGTKGILKTGGGTCVISGGASIVQTQKNGIIRVDGPTDVLEFAMPYSVPFKQRFMKSGEGTLIFSQSGTFSFASGWGIWLNGGVMEIGGSTTLSDVSDNMLIANGALFKYNSSSTNSTFLSFTGAGGVTVSNGKLTLSGASTFSGRLTVDGGTLAIPTINNANAGGVLGNSALSVILGKSGGAGTLQYTGATASSTKPFTLADGGVGIFRIESSGTALTLSGQIDGGGGLTKTGGGSLILAGATTYTGDTIVSEGTLTVENAGDAGLNDLAAVKIEMGAMMELGFSGNDTVGELWLSGTQMPKGSYNSSTPGGYFIGSGTLVVGSGVVPGDTNDDGVVNAADYIAVKKNFGTGTTLLQGDLSGDGSVNYADLQILMGGLATNGGAPAVTPEPATLGLLALGALAVIRRRRA